jgi:hypothetical protein
MQFQDGILKTFKKYFVDPVKQNLRDFTIITLFVIITVYLVILAYSTRESKFDILVDFRSEECVVDKDTITYQCYKLNGALLKQGRPVEGAIVSLIILGESGSQTYSSPITDTTDKAGAFTFNPIKKYFGEVKAKENIENTSKASISKEVVKKIIVKVITKDYEAEEIILEINKANQVIARTYTKINIFQIAYLPFIFVVSILFPIILFSPRAKYICSISSAIIFSAGMIITISNWIGFVSQIDPNEALSLGFLHFSKYRNEWILSLTSPLNIQSGGFWVPVWVMMLSVIGSSLFTILLILKQINDVPKFLNLLNKLEKGLISFEDKEVIEAHKEFDNVLENIVRHQFYILFSPLGSIFVYQLLVMGNAAENQTTVAITALASGIVLNSILAKALDLTEKLVGSVEKRNKK